MILAYSKISDGNMDFRFGNLKEVLNNRNNFFKKLALNPKSIMEINQVHGNNVILLEKIVSAETCADGMITNKTGIYLMLKLADCIPITLYDSKHKTIALIHAGLKGLKKGIIKNAIYKMKGNFDTDLKDLTVKLGPSIGPCCYRTDLWELAENQLIQNGISRENIQNLRICTYENKEYFSHRRSGDTNRPEGRFVTILGL